MVLSDMEYDAIVDTATNIVISSVLEPHERVLAEEQALRDRWNNRREMYGADSSWYANDHIT
jgi:hypothetical protein